MYGCIFLHFQNSFFIAFRLIRLPVTKVEYFFYFSGQLQFHLKKTKMMKIETARWESFSIKDTFLGISYLVAWSCFMRFKIPFMFQILK